MLQAALKPWLLRHLGDEFAESGYQRFDAGLEALVRLDQALVRLFDARSETLVGTDHSLDTSPARLDAILLLLLAPLRGQRGHDLGYVGLTLSANGAEPDPSAIERVIGARASTTTTTLAGGR